MKRWLIVAPILLGVAFLFNTSLAVAGEEPDKPYDEPYDGAVVCLPERFYKRPVGECLSLGPAAYLKRMASLGITFPLRPFPGKVPDPSLA
ncbi:MAG TPA: hypothetical protein VE136_16265, partial [Anaerolineales bacterium]|nr:hypothetical protein [Anaerolineales bacterium]